MRDVLLGLNKRVNEMVAVIAEDSGAITEIPLTTVKSTPMTKIPVLVADPTGRLGEDLLNILMAKYLEDSPDSWWQGYYQERLKDAVKYADQIKEADRTFKSSDVHFTTR